jgi:hypothetical protein
VSTAMLRYENGLTADCSNFPNVGDSLCIPETCKIYTVKVNDTCYGISEAYNATFTVTQLISWNPDINRDCSNLEAITGTLICIRYRNIIIIWLSSLCLPFSFLFTSTLTSLKVQQETKESRA